MRKLVSILFACLFMIGCAEEDRLQMYAIDGDDGAPGTSCSVVDTATGAEIRCDDGTVVTVEDGADNNILTSLLLPRNSCTKVADGVFVENIQNGYIFDVYKHRSCSDYVGGILQEYCDNVSTSYGHSGSLGQDEPGSSTFCWVDEVQFSGIRLANGSILLMILDFSI